MKKHFAVLTDGLRWSFFALKENGIDLYESNTFEHKSNSKQILTLLAALIRGELPLGVELQE